VPTSAYFGGHGLSVKRDLVKRHGKKKGERIFYALANKRKQRPQDRHG
jgi:hypothetical protein